MSRQKLGEHYLKARDGGKGVAHIICHTCISHTTEIQL
jgi:hypothetical protein